MARVGSTTSRRKASPAVAAAETAADSMVEAATTPAVISAENDFDSTMVESEGNTHESTTEVEETDSMSTETVEAPVEETVVSDTTEAVEVSEADKAAEAEKKAADEAAAKANHEAFVATVKTALEARDTSTGTLPEADVEPVRKAYRNLSGAKNKNAAKKHLTDLLQDAINSSDIQLGMAIMQVTQVVNSTTAAAKPPVERKPVDPSQRYVEDLAVLNLAYLLRRADVPSGVEVDGENGAYARAEELVGKMTDEAEEYYTWLKSTDPEKGDEPEASALVKRAIKASFLKAVSLPKARTASVPRVHAGPNRNVRTHIAQVFADKESGTVLRISEIANAKSEEYPDGDCSPGAISAAMKSTKGVEGFERATDGNGHLAARKL